MGLLPRQLEIACIVHQTVSVGKGCDRLQLIKFWQSCAPGKGSAAGENFWPALLQPARSVCVSLSAFFIKVVLFAANHIADATNSNFFPSFY